MIATILAVILLGLWVLWAVKNRKKGSCCGDCSHCGKTCKSKSDAEGEQSWL